MTTLAAVKKAKLLDDNKVRHTLSNLSKWESAIEKIKESKDKSTKILSKPLLMMQKLRR